MRIVLGILLSAFSLSNAAPEVGPIPGTQPIGPIFGLSDVVCLCSIQFVEVTQGEPAADFAVSKTLRRQVTMRAEARHIYKSDRPDTQQFLIEYTEDVGITSPIRTVLERGDTALLFLKAVSPTAYQFGDRFLGVTRFSALPNGAGGSGLGGLETTLATLARQENKDDRLNALRLLQGFDSLSQNSLSSVNTLISSEDPQIAFAALAVLLKTGTPSAVEKLKHYVESYQGTAEPISLISIGTELGEVSNEKALSTIEALASCRFQSIRYGATQSLRKMRNPQAAPILVQRLDDPNSTIQYLAVITLAETLGKFEGDYAPSMYLFDKKPQYYVGIWKKWWTEEGLARYSSGGAKP